LLSAVQANVEEQEKPVRQVPQTPPQLSAPHAIFVHIGTHKGIVVGIGIIVGVAGLGVAVGTAVIVGTGVTVGTNEL
jgi:hypothetical protein